MFKRCRGKRSSSSWHSVRNVRSALAPWTLQTSHRTRDSIAADNSTDRTRMLSLTRMKHDVGKEQVIREVAAATTCERSHDPSLQNSPAAFQFASSDDLNWFSTHNCTTIDDDITLLGSFTGSLSLPNVTSINGVITYTAPTETFELTSISLPDVLYLGGINVHLPSSQEIIEVSAPKATAVGTISLAVLSTAAVDFRSLKQATSISLAGNYSSVRLDSLEQVNGNLSILGSDTIATNYLDNEAHGQLPLSFPALKYATFIRFSGVITEFSMPVLETTNIQTRNYLGPSGVSIHNYGATVDLDLPKLRSVGDMLDLQGAISNLSLDSLQSIQGNITVNSSSYLEVNFTSLYSAETIQLNGNITSAGFPSLTGVSRITINTTDPIDCSSFQRAIQRAAPASNSTCNGTGMTGVTSTSGRGLSTRAKVGIAIGVSIAGIIIVGLIIWYEQTMARNYKARAGFHWGPQIPLQDRSRRRSALEDDPPPPYSLHPPPN
ncbi:hypothetical protein CNMCM7927_002833 [Aspergillus lentulus]|nr:hypothetical protein CNMCM7927_002833 [Aspergillus lentulus]